MLSLSLFDNCCSLSALMTPGENDIYEEYKNNNGVGYTDRQGKLLKLSAAIDMDSRLAVGCAGAVLTYIGRRKAVEHLPGDLNANSLFRISKVERFSIKDTMYAELWLLVNSSQY